jgi:enolase-phosphatase E1
MTRRRAVVLDIEGTTSPLDSVRTELFGYARAAYATWLPAQAATADVSAALTRICAEAGLDRATTAVPVLVRLLSDWTDDDVKSPGLKAIQGLIWRDGFAHRELRGTVYPDVVAAMRDWHSAGIEIAVYSSGSALAQRDWFGHSDHGDLRGLITDYFDLLNAGAKRSPASYQTISARLRIDPSAVTFLSDVDAELDAASSAGWQAVGVWRPGNPPVPRASRHRWITDFTAALNAAGAAA